jgi:serine/threonine protein phosphatase PrpC
MALSPDFLGWIYAKGVRGSSTACVATFIKKEEGSMQLDILNVGDSGVLVVENETGKVIFKTEEQQHYFNCPFQLGHSNDRPEHGNTYSLNFTPGTPSPIILLFLRSVSRSGYGWVV